MISVIYSTRQSKPEFKDHLIKSSGLNDIEVIEVINNGEFSLSEVYNKLIRESKSNICVCIHDDVILGSKWGVKLLKDFDKYPDAAIIGKAGTIEMPESGIYWEKMQSHMVGHVWHKLGDQPAHLSAYSIDPGGMIEVASIDGLFIAFDKTKIKKEFDETLPGFHFYDHGFAFPNTLAGAKSYVTFSFEITHLSGGATNDYFEKNRLRFIMKYSDVLPYKVKTKIFYSKNNPVISDKKQELVSIIIPHIHKNHLLFDCIDTLLESTTYSKFEILIADTGSSEETKDQIKNKYSGNDKVKLIEYDYYNFASINNDVVKNHIDPKSKYILFLNNDVSFLKDNDVLSKLVKCMIDNPNAASAGPRLYFDLNGPIQHAGMYSYTRKGGEKSPHSTFFEITHYGINSYYTYYTNPYQHVIGCTGACLIYRTNLFNKFGGFPVTKSCFEDCVIEFKAIVNGNKNIFVSDAVAIHGESQTRNDDPDNLKKLREDYSEVLAPYVQSNFEKLKPYIHVFNN